MHAKFCSYRFVFLLILYGFKLFPSKWHHTFLPPWLLALILYFIRDCLKQNGQRAHQLWPLIVPQNLLFLCKKMKCKNKNLLLLGQCINFYCAERSKYYLATPFYYHCSHTLRVVPPSSLLLLLYYLPPLSFWVHKVYWVSLNFTNYLQ